MTPHIPKGINVDPRCYELAAYFLYDEKPPPDEQRIMALARVIQQAAEDWILYTEERG